VAGSNWPRSSRRTFQYRRVFLFIQQQVNTEGKLGPESERSRFRACFGRKSSIDWSVKRPLEFLWTSPDERSRPCHTPPPSAPHHPLEKRFDKLTAAGDTGNAVQWSFTAFYSGLTGGSTSMNSRPLGAATSPTPPRTIVRRPNLLVSLRDAICVCYSGLKRCQYDDDLYACAQSRREGSAEPGGWALRGMFFC